MVMVALLGPTEAGEVLLGRVRAGAAIAVGLAVIDALDLVLSVKRVP